MKEGTKIRWKEKSIIKEGISKLTCIYIMWIHVWTVCWEGKKRCQIAMKLESGV